MSKKMKTVIPYVDDVSQKKRKKSVRRKALDCDLTGLVERMYRDNLHLVAENTHLVAENIRLRERMAVTQVMESDFIVLEPNSMEDEDDDRI